MKTITATFRIVTPMFIAGADQTQAELRAPSIKGALRFWHRARDPSFPNSEAMMFGASDDNHGQSRFLLTVSNTCNETWTYRRNGFRHFDEPRNAGDQTKARNGFNYLAFSLGMKGGNHRRALAPGREFTLTLRFRKTCEQHIRDTCAALWLLAHFGGLGSRSRRGFGGLQLTSTDGPWPEGVSALSEVSEAEAWFERVTTGLQRLKPDAGFAQGDHAHLRGARIKLFMEGDDTWEMALNRAGRAMQDFRQRWDTKNANADTDYYRVKSYLCHEDKRAAKTPAGTVLTPAMLDTAPARCSFGLPFGFPILFAPISKTRKRQPEIQRERRSGNADAGSYVRRSCRSRSERKNRPQRLAHSYPHRPHR